MLNQDAKADRFGEKGRLGLPDVDAGRFPPCSPRENRRCAPTATTPTTFWRAELRETSCADVDDGGCLLCSTDLLGLGAAFSPARAEGPYPTCFYNVPGQCFRSNRRHLYGLRRLQSTADDAFAAA